jgi:hypothetical protein
MKRNNGTRVLIGAIASLSVLFVIVVGSASARVFRNSMVTIRTSAAPVTRTFSFIGRPGSKTSTIFNIDGFLVNARCSTSGSPIIFGFPRTSTPADLFGRMFDGLGRFHIIKNSSFNRSTSGVALYTTSQDFDATGSVAFETSSGKVVTVDYAFDNATTLSKQNVCTVYGSYVAT